MHIAAFVAFIVFFPFGASASDLGKLIAGGGERISIAGEEWTGRTDVTRSVEIVAIDPNTPPVLSAPDAQAILVVNENTVVRLDGIEFRHAGNTEFAIYVNGGRLEISNCRIFGAFPFGIYIAAGQVTLRDCVVEGTGSGIMVQQGSTLLVEDATIRQTTSAAIAAVGSRVSIRNSRVEPASELGIQVSQNGDLQASGLNLSGTARYGLVLSEGAGGTLRNTAFTGASDIALAAQNSGDVDIETLLVGTGAAKALTVSRSASLRISDFRLSATGPQVQITDVENAHLSDGRLIGQQETPVATFRDTPGLALERLSWSGPGLALGLQGDQTNSRITSSNIVGATEGAVELVDFATDSSGVTLENLLIATAGQNATALFAKNGGTVNLVGNRIAVQRSGALYVENVTLGNSAENLVVSLPAQQKERFLAKAAPGEAGVLVLDGPILTVYGPEIEAGEIAGFEAFSILDVLKQTTALPDISAELLRLASSNETVPADVLAAALLSLDPSTPFVEGMRRIAIASPFEHLRWDAFVEPVDILGPDGDEFGLLRPGSWMQVPEVTLAARLAGGDLVVMPPEGDFVFSPDAFGQARLVWRDDDGNGVLGRALRWRPKTERALLLSGLPIPWRFYSHDGDARKMAVSGEGAAMLPDARNGARAIFPQIAAAEEWERQHALRATFDRYLKIIEAFGGPQEVAYLVELDAGQVDYRIMRTLAAMSMRIGGDATDALERMLKQQVAREPESGQTQTRVLLAAATGNAYALSELVSLHDRLVAGQPGVPVEFGLDILWLAPPEVSVPRYREFLRRARADLLGILRDAAQLPGRYLYSNLWRAIGYASVVLAAHGTPEDEKMLAVPVPARASIIELAPFVSNPEAVAGAFFGGLGKVPGHRISNLERHLGDLICRAGTMRSGEPRKKIFGDIVNEVFLARFIDASDPAARMRNLAYQVDMAASHCRPNNFALEIASLGQEDDAGEERRKFHNQSYDMRWWYRPVRARQLVTRFAEAPHTDMTGLSAFSQEALTEMAEDHAGRAWHSFIMENAVVSDAWRDPTWFAPFGSERRIFRLRNDKGSGPVSILGYVDLRPVATGDRLFLAIGHSLNIVNFDGLAAAISRQYDEPPFRDNSFRGTFSDVSVSRGGTVQAASFVGTFEDGTHIFEIPYNGDLLDARIHVDMKYLDAEWQLDFGLFKSEFALARRFEAAFSEVVK